MKKLEKEFADPGKEYRGAPFWSWNDEMDPAEVKRQVRLMDEGGQGGFFMHSREGLVTEYMGDDWIKAIKAAVAEGKKRGMLAWLYDEDRWPSGFVSGKVPALGPEYRQKKLTCLELDSVDGVENLVRAYKAKRKGLRLSGLVDITEEVLARGRAGKSPGFKYYCLYKLVQETGDPWYNGYCYLDTLSTKAVDAFIELTHEQYKKAVGRDFGGSVPGIFTDEPYFTDKPYSVPWTDDFDEVFEKRNGYPLPGEALSLFFDTGRWRKVRLDYWNTVTRLFALRFGKRLYDWCEANGLELTGHYLFEDNFKTQTCCIGAAMPHYEYMQRPGIDHLGRNLYDIMTSKQCSSAAHQFGRRMVLSETFGCSGQNMSFADQKWIADWQFALGINYINQHLALYTMRGSRKRDYPPNIHFQQPYWKRHKALGDYFGRASLMLSSGEFQADILMLHTIGSAWAVFSRYDDSRCFDYSKPFDQLSHILTGLHRDYDYGDEILLERHGRVRGRELKMGKHSYKLAVIPPAQSIELKTLELLESFAAAGGPILALKPLPKFVNGRKDRRLGALLEHEGVTVIDLDAEAVESALDRLLPRRVSLKGPDGREARKILVHERKINGRRFFFLANSDQRLGIKVSLEVPGRGRAREWDLAAGVVKHAACRQRRGFVEIPLELAPMGSALIEIGPGKPAVEPKPAPEPVRTVELGAQWKIVERDLNSMTLDYCRFRLGVRGEFGDPVPVFKARRAAEEARPGTRIDLVFEFDSELDADLDRPVFLVMERPAHYSIKVNGRKVDGNKDSGYWLDTEFRKLDIGSLVKTGTNRIELGARTTRITKPNTRSYLEGGVEIEEMYLLGRFGVQGGPKEFYLCEEKPTAVGGDLTSQGFPFFAGELALEQEFEFEPLAGTETRVLIQGLHAVVASVSVNGRDAGALYWPPYSLDVSGLVRRGRNVLRLTLCHSLRNLLGPNHHGGGELFSVGPGSFADERNWTDEYQLVRFGADGVRLVSYR